MNTAISEIAAMNAEAARQNAQIQKLTAEGAREKARHDAMMQAIANLK